MDEKITYWASVVLGAGALLLLVTNISMINSNQKTQRDVSDRQQAIARGNNLSQVNQSLVQLLVTSSIRDSDTQIKDLLAAQGITIKPQGAPAAATDAAKSKKK